MEDAVLAHLHPVAARSPQLLDPAHVEAALTAAPTALGPDQAAAVRAAGRPVVVAPHKAVAELRSAGVEAHTGARLCLQLSEATLAPGGVLIVDQVSSSPPATARRWPPAAWSSGSSACGPGPDRLHDPPP